MSKQIKCPSCDTVQDIDNKFCIHCGFDLTSMPKNIFSLIKKINCPNCDNKIPKDSKICPFCKFNLSNQNLPNSSEDFKKCPNCKEEVLKSNDICPNCGYNFITKKNYEVKHNPLSKLDSFKRNAIFSSNFDFNLKLCPNCNSELLFEDNYCYNCGLDVININNVVKIPKPTVSKQLEFKRKVIFSSNFDFNLKLCPNCNFELLFEDNFCFNCGEKVTDKEIENIKKPISKSENNNSSMHKTVPTNYESTFKIAFVLYLDEFRKNPKKGFSQTIAKNYDTSVEDLKKQAISDEFIELESPLTVANNLKLTDIKEVLRNHGLKVSGKKDELIERLSENLSQEELTDIFKPENYQITDEGLNFINNNSYLIYLHKNSEVSNIISPPVCVDLFDEREYSTEEIYATFINYLNNELINELKEGKFDKFRDYSNAIASILKDQENLKDALVISFEVFLFDINNYSSELQPVPSETKLKSKDIGKLIDLIIKLNISLEEVRQLFAVSCHEFPFERIISDQDSWKYLVKIINGEDLKSVSKEINEDYLN